MTKRLSLRCPACAAKLRARLNLVGSICPCPRCKYRLRVQPPAPTDADVALVGDEATHPTPWKSRAPWC